MVRALVGTLSTAVAVAASQCTDTVVLEGARFDLQSETWGENALATAVDSTGNVWIASIVNGTSMISMCKKDGDCISKQYGSGPNQIDRIAVDHSGPLPVVSVREEYGLYQCVWDPDTFDRVSCHGFYQEAHPVLRKVGKDTEFAVDNEGTIFLEDLCGDPQGSLSQSALWRCSGSTQKCELWGGNFWDDATDIFNIATDSQGNVYVSFAVLENRFETRFAKCSPTGSCEEVTFPGSEEGDTLDGRKFVVGPDDNIYSMDDYGPLVLIQCSVGSSCNRVLVLPNGDFTGNGVTDRYTYSVGKSGDLYAVESWNIKTGWFGGTEQLDVVRRCFTPQRKAIQV